ncbi:MAG: D-alanyl-D-alanine dipeptidase [Candidatus Levybacteria bacterium CG10_big_fil_rev_8_21_14_0_10_35_13]|nr:MAG: D-alanyl-D-alanine dipeptidase [Candidatus Levybacteria bacterium CG10_big_fil_rev_8_21_14_0_10_35_13]
MILSELGRFKLTSSMEIPEIKPMHGWKEVKIEESSQPLVCLNHFDPSGRIRLSPQYFLHEIPGTSPFMYLREEAADRLTFAASKLRKGTNIVVFDAHRSIEIQGEIFNSFRVKLKTLNPRLPEDELTKLTEIYVSLPSRDPLKPPPHSTGGAIDLSIEDDYSNLARMGTDWDSFDIKSQTNYFKNVNPLFHYNRRVLYAIMTSAGFTNYPEEWWHYDFGNQFWGFLTEKSAIYGQIKGGELYDK